MKHEMRSFKKFIEEGTPSETMGKHERLPWLGTDISPGAEDDYMNPRRQFVAELLKVTHGADITPEIYKMNGTNKLLKMMIGNMPWARLVHSRPELQGKGLEQLESERDRYNILKTMALRISRSR